MGVDFIGKFNQLKTAYERERGALSPTGKKNSITNQPLIPRPKAVPKTTWADVALVFAHLKKIGEPSTAECLEMMPGDFFSCHKALNFVRTTGFNRAKEAFDNLNPYWIASRRTSSPGNIIAGAQYVMSHPLETFPQNEEFWGYANHYVIARSAAGEVPHWRDIAVESIGHAIGGLPTLIKDGLEKTFNAIPNLIPDVSTAFTIIKWTAILGSAGLVYWYVARPLIRLARSAGGQAA